MPEWYLLLKQVISASYMNNDSFYLILIQMQKTKIGVGDKKNHLNILKCSAIFRSHLYTQLQEGPRSI